MFNVNISAEDLKYFDKIDVDSFHRKYSAIQKIGEGSFGKVFLCEDNEPSDVTNRYFAIKMVNFAKALLQTLC
jgi:serine/threonine protein kinase